MYLDILSDHQSRHRVMDIGAFRDDLARDLAARDANAAQ